jgi:peptide-methionine (S)-S-oxide reductase
MKNNTTRLSYLLGESNIKVLSRSTVAIVGIGGVGSVACEVLARSGVGTLIIVDKDIVDITNINRQLIADVQTIGRKKVDVMKEKILLVNPNATIYAYAEAFGKTNDSFLFHHNIDYLIDAIDAIEDKFHLIKTCLNHHIPFVSAMGAANKLDPTTFKVVDIEKSTHDPLARILRKKLRDEQIRDKIRVIYSDEIVKNNQKEAVGSYMAVTATSGILAANEAIKELTKYREIILAGGCFWGVEGYYKLLNGVIDTDVGYTDGSSNDPNYQDLCKGLIDHVEACQIIYDPTIITLTDILDHLFRFIDPTSLNKQGGDIGRQYRTGIYYEQESDKKIIEDFFASQQPKYVKPIVVDVKPKTTFYPAEDYHQDYLDKHPDGYCHVDFGLIQDGEKK